MGMYTNTIYNGPKKDKCFTDTRVAMMFSKKGKGKCTKKSTKVIPPGEKSLKMKILKSHFVAHCWKNCLNNNNMHLDPTDCGWQRVNDLLVPLWYEICNLPTDEEYYQHIHGERNMDYSIVDENAENSDSDSTDNESEDEYPSSNATSSSSEDEL